MTARRSLAVAPSENDRHRRCRVNFSKISKVSASPSDCRSSRAPRAVAICSSASSRSDQRLKVLLWVWLSFQRWRKTFAWGCSVTPVSSGFAARKRSTAKSRIDGTAAE